MKKRRLLCVTRCIDCVSNRSQTLRPDRVQGMGLREQVDQPAASTGVLSRMVHAFHPRAGQIEMAQAIARTIEEVARWLSRPAQAWARRFPIWFRPCSAGHGVVVDGDQDLAGPAVCPRSACAGAGSALPLRTALLKGRGSYPRLHRLDMARQDPSDVRSHAGPHAGQDRTMGAGHAQRRSGRTVRTRSECSPVLARTATSTRDNCLGAMSAVARLPCQPGTARGAGRRRGCHQPPSVLCRSGGAQSGMAELLPSVQTVVFDQQHQLNETGLQFLGRQL